MKRINKATARKLWENNLNFILVPCKCSPAGLGSLDTETDLSSPDFEERRSFDAFVNEFEFYNCNNETGRYAAFYARG